MGFLWPPVLWNFSLPNKSNSEKDNTEINLMDQINSKRYEIYRLTIELIDHYVNLGRIADAIIYVDWLADFSIDRGEKAQLFLRQGVHMECGENWEAAVEFYKVGISKNPVDKGLQYYLFNNLGFCLAKLGSFDESVLYCQKAIRIDSDQYNAHKNLGIALEGKQLYKEAGEQYLIAIKANENDTRALDHLTCMIKNVPGLLNEISEIRDIINLPPNKI